MSRTRPYTQIPLAQVAKPAGPSAHLICVCCGEIEEIPLYGEVSRMISIPRGAMLDDIQMMCSGLCAKCNGGNKVN